jgi:hypothetical protein
MKREAIDRQAIVRRLSIALDSVTAALIAVGDLPVDPTDDALDEVLRQHRGVLQARKAFRKCLNALLAGVRTEADRMAVLDLEAATNAVVFNSADAGYRLGLLVGWGAGRAESEAARALALAGQFPGETKE